MENQTEDPELTMEFPKQAYYNLIVYDLPAEGVDEMFASSGDVDDEILLEMCNLGLDYIEDRINEGSHSEEDDNLPSGERLNDVKDKLESWEEKIIGDEEEQ